MVALRRLSRPKQSVDLAMGMLLDIRVDEHMFT